MLVDYYAIKDPAQLENFLRVYVPLVVNVAKNLGIDLTEEQFAGDHLGVQVLSKKEFDQCGDWLLKYASLIHDQMIHERRNRVYAFNHSFVIQGIQVPRVEIFEPKPGADLRKLKPGVEHMAFMTRNYDDFLSQCMKRKMPIDKQLEFDDGSKFFKTRLVNLVEIEFRNDFLGVAKK